MAGDRIAVCTCGAPLMFTFVFRSVEWYCVECGRKYGLLDVEKAARTPELEARLVELEAVFKPLAAQLIPGGARKLGRCGKCDAGDDHSHHATTEEWTADRDARDRLTELALSAA